MKLLYGTKNPAKISVMEKRLNKLGIELIGLNNLNSGIPDVPEDGSTPLENARQKAEAYYKAFKMPVFSCDSGLYFDNVPDHVQPGVHVRTVNGKRLTDDGMAAYYSGLAMKKGFPLDSLAIDVKSGRYYYDLPEEELKQMDVEDGFLEFFKEILKKHTLI